MKRSWQLGLAPRLAGAAAAVTALLSLFLALQTSFKLGTSLAAFGMKPERIELVVASQRSTMLLWNAVLTTAAFTSVLVAARLLVLRPVRDLTRVANEILRSGDLTQKIAPTSNDEIGKLTSSVSSMVERLREVAGHLQAGMGSLNKSVANLSISTAEQSQSANRQATALEQTQITAQEIKQTSLLASQKAEAVLKVTERADEIGRTGETAIERSLGGLAEIRTQVEDIARQINELSSRTRQIGGITQTVKDLADQSNMLALNAAIEAVRSGEHGKGFAVVAREIRSLADQSIQATHRVRELLDDIGRAIKTTVSITEQGARRMEAELQQMKGSGQNLRELSSIVRDNSAAVRQIVAAVSQQNAGFGQIFDAVTELSSMMEDSVTRLDSTRQAAESIQEISTKMSGAVTRYRV